MKRINVRTLTAVLLLTIAVKADAQLSQNPDKFLGNITTGWPGSMNWDGFTYSDYWNQVTPENSTKWEVVEGTRNSYNWSGADTAYRYAAQKGFPFKFHTLIWGSQYPGWLKSLSADERYKAIEKWMDTVKKKYPNLEIIDVANEAVEGHQPDTYLFIEALGGKGKTGYDWLIKAFEMAYERWPNAILIYNDFNTFQWNTDQYIELVRTLRNAGAPIDAYGCQSHDLGGLEGSKFKTAMKKIQDALKMPMYITEYDIGDTNDANQKWNFQQHIPVMWEADYCAGVTLWGWFYGQTWLKDDNTGETGISGLIKNKKERSALTWLREYMATDKAKTAKSPFPGMKKEASLYIKPAALKVATGSPVAVEIRAAMRTKTIDHIDFYVNGVKQQTLTEAPYKTECTPAANGTYTLKSVAVTTDGSSYERLSAFTATDKFVPGQGEPVVAKRFTSVSQIGSTTFAIVDESCGKAIYGTDLQNLGFAELQTAFNDDVSGYYWRLESLSGSADASVRNYYLLRLVTPAGGYYSIWNNPGYLNSQPANKNCCFVLGLNNQNGQDMKNGAVWDVQYVDGKGFTLRNIATGKYLRDAAPAKYDEPSYFTFCTIGTSTGISPVTVSPRQNADGSVYNLQGVRVGIVGQWNSLPHGIYIVNGKKTVR